MNISYFRKINNLQGVSNKREAELNNVKRYLSSEFDANVNPIAFSVKLNEFVDRTVLILDDSLKEHTKKIIAKPNESLHCGDIVYWIKEQSYWIVTLLEPNDDIYSKGIIKPCVGQLKWVDDEGIIRSSHFTFKTDPATNFGVQDGRILSIGNERRSLLISMNEHTAKLTKGVRFIFDNRAWSISAIDTISISGLSILTVDEDEIDTAADNVELGIADYIGRVANYTLTILNAENFSINAGMTLQLNVEIKNNGAITNKPLSYSSSNELLATVDENGIITSHANNGNVTITVTLVDDPTISDSIIVHVESIAQDNYTVSFVESPYVYVNKTKTFTVQVRKNGVIDSTKFVNWSLFDEDKISVNTSYASMVSSSTSQVTLKGLDVGIVWLRAFLIGYSQTFWIKVEIKSLI